MVCSPRPRSFFAADPGILPHTMSKSSSEMNFLILSTGDLCGSLSGLAFMCNCLDPCLWLPQLVRLSAEWCSGSSFGATLRWCADESGVISAWLGIGVLSEPEASIFYRLGKVSLPSNKMGSSLARGY